MKYASWRAVVACSVMLCAGGILQSGSAQAAVIRSGESVSVPAEARVDTDMYAAGSNVHLSGPIDGDLYAAGGNIVVNGDVGGDVVVVGGTVTINGSVADDIRVIGGTVVLGGEVGGDVLALGGTTALLSEGVVAGEVLLYAGDVRIDGTVEGLIHGDVNSLVVGGKVGAIDITVAKDLSLTETAVVSKDVVYRGPDELYRDPQTVIEGDVRRLESTTDVAASGFSVNVSFILMTLFGSLMLVFAAQSFLQRLFTTHMPHFAVAGLIGLGTLLVIPLLAGALIFVVMGALVGATLLFIYGGLLVVSALMIPAGIGALLAQVTQKNLTVSWLYTIIGVAVVHVLFLIPVFGPLVLFVGLVGCLGMLVRHGYSLWSA